MRTRRSRRRRRRRRDLHWLSGSARRGSSATPGRSRRAASRPRTRTSAREFALACPSLESVEGPVQVVLIALRFAHPTVVGRQISDAVRVEHAADACDVLGGRELPGEWSRRKLEEQTEVFASISTTGSRCPHQRVRSGQRRGCSPIQGHRNQHGPPTTISTWHPGTLPVMRRTGTLQRSASLARGCKRESRGSSAHTDRRRRGREGSASTPALHTDVAWSPARFAPWFSSGT